MQWVIVTPLPQTHPPSLRCGPRITLDGKGLHLASTRLQNIISIPYKENLSIFPYTQVIFVSSGFCHLDMQFHTDL